jgi:putative GTP pyrophosphokinase
MSLIRGEIQEAQAFFTRNKEFKQEEKS